MVPPISFSISYSFWVAGFIKYKWLYDSVKIPSPGKIIALDQPDQLIDQLLANGFEKQKESKDCAKSPFEHSS
jgi:hypothetical protein